MELAGPSWGGQNRERSQIKQRARNRIFFAKRVRSFFEDGTDRGRRPNMRQIRKRRDLRDERRIS
jgi:hypothetical protein